MGDMGEIFEAMREHNRERKQRQHAQVPHVLQRLEQSGLEFQKFSDEHYRVWTKNGRAWFDFWPSTGRFRSKDGKRTGFNIGPLLQACQNNNPNAGAGRKRYPAVFKKES